MRVVKNTYVSYVSVVIVAISVCFAAQTPKSKCPAVQFSHYGIPLDVKALSEPNLICESPANSKENCCSRAAQLFIAKKLNAEKFDSSNFYVAHTFIHRYILGYADQFWLLAQMIAEAPAETGGPSSLLSKSVSLGGAQSKSISGSSVLTKSVASSGTLSKSTVLNKSVTESGSLTKSGNLGNKGGSVSQVLAKSEETKVIINPPEQKTEIIEIQIAETKPEPTVEVVKVEEVKVEAPKPEEPKPEEPKPEEPKPEEPKPEEPKPAEPKPEEPKPEEPKPEEPKPEEPKPEEPKPEEPKPEEPKPEEPKAETPKPEEPKPEEPKPEEPKPEEPKPEEPKPEEPKPEEPKPEEPKPEEPKPEEPKPEEPKPEEPKPEEPKPEEPKPEEPKPEEPKPEEPKPEEPKPEEPKPEEPKPEEPKPEEPKPEEPKPEEPKPEEPKPEEPKAEEPKAEEPPAEARLLSLKPLINNFKVRSTPSCRQAAQAFLSLKPEAIPKITKLYNQIFESAAFQKSAQDNLYCYMCNTDSRKTFTDPKGTTPGTIKYSRNFCSSIVSKVLPVVEGYHSYYNPFLRALLNLLPCVRPVGQDPNPKEQKPSEARKLYKELSEAKVEDPNWTSKASEGLKSLLSNPLGLDSDQFFKPCLNQPLSGTAFIKPCQPFCQRFGIIKKTKHYHGSICSQTKVYKIIKSYEWALRDSSKNLFKDDMKQLRQVIGDSKKELECEPMLVKTDKGAKGIESYNAVVDDKDTGYDPSVYKFKKAANKGLLAMRRLIDGLNIV